MTQYGCTLRRLKFEAEQYFVCVCLCVCVCVCVLQLNAGKNTVHTILKIQGGQNSVNDKIHIYRYRYLDFGSPLKYEGVPEQLGVLSWTERS